MKYRFLIASCAALAATLVWANILPANGRELDFSAAYSGADISIAFQNCSTTTSGGITLVTPPAPGSNCNIQPDEQTVSIYRLALCTSKPVAPTTLGASSLSECNFIFTSTSNTGSPVSIALNTIAALPNGTITKPANGTYTHLYVEIDPKVKIKSSLHFDTDMADSNGLTTGAYCWSKAMGTFNFASNTFGSMPQATECASSAPTPISVAATSSVYNSIMDDRGTPFNGSGFTYAVVKLPTTAGGPSTLDAYLIGTDGKLVATQNVNDIGTVVRAAGIMTLPSPGVVVTNATTSFVLGYNNTKGAQVSTQTTTGGNPSRISKFGNGPFDMTVTVQ